MAVIVTFDMPGATRAMYDEGMDRLSGGAGFASRTEWPVPGMIAHIAGPSPTGWFVTDVWESKEAFERFAAVLVPVLKELGYPDSPPLVFPAYNVVID